jgi:hypothetical protein
MAEVVIFKPALLKFVRQRFELKLLISLSIHLLNHYALHGVNKCVFNKIHKFCLN